MLAAPIVSSCTIVWRTVEARPVATNAQAQNVTSPVRAYLSDGAVVVLPQGASVAGGRLSGVGVRYSLGLESEEIFADISLDSVVAVEAFHGGYENVVASAALLAASVVGAALGTSVLLVAVFGSCPTIYGEVEGESVLQSEPFSHSITRLFESRDVDRLATSPGPDGILRLELRNEALETHYINHMELLQVTHPLEAEVLADPTGRPLLLSGVQPPARAVDRWGRDVHPLVTRGGGQAFRSERERLGAVTEDDFHDWIDLEFAAGGDVGPAALVLRARNTLLTSVLFYEVMLAESGHRSLDWLARDLERIGTAAELASWYRQSMGMRVLVDEGEGFQEVAYLPDVGPLAWTERAIPIPRLSAGARVRLAFPVDAWFIDRVAVATRVQQAEVTRIPVSRVIEADGTPDPTHLRRLAAPDEDYLVTLPGQRLHLEFDTALQVPTLPASSGAEARTHLLATQGYYVEWVRGTWLQDGGRDTPFEPSDAAILDAMERWARIMDDYERDFFDSRIPVR
jgi:hypothetical protein